MVDKEAKDYIFGSILAYGHLWEQWAPIFSNKQKYELWLRRNSISIWLRGLSDYLKKEEQRTIAFDGFQTIDEITNLILLFDQTTKSILGEINEDLQIFVWFVRNQALHGHLSLYYHDNLGIDIFDKISGTVIKKTISRKEMSDSIDRANEANKTITETLESNKEYIYFLKNGSKLAGEHAQNRYHIQLFGKEIS